MYSLPDPVSTPVVFALVLHCDLEIIPELKRLIEARGARIVYQKTSSEKLYITTELPPDLRWRSR